MKVKCKNIWYQASCDGYLLTYKVRQPWKQLFKLMKLATQVEMPINVVLSYKDRGKVLGRKITLYYHYTRFNSGLNLKKISLLVGRDKFQKGLTEQLDELIALTHAGNNIGLADLPLHELERYYHRPKPAKAPRPSMGEALRARLAFKTGQYHRYELETNESNRI